MVAIDARSYGRVADPQSARYLPIRNLPMRPAVAADAAMDVSGVGALLHFIATGCCQGSIRYGPVADPVRIVCSG